VKGEAVVTDDEAPEDEVSEQDRPEEPAAERTAEADEFWQDVRVDPVEIALPSGVGYTLRAYRTTDTLTPVPGEEPEEDDEVVEEPADSEVLPEDPDEEPDDSDEPDSDEPADSAEDDEDEEKDDEDDEPEPAEVPLFLSRQGGLLLFRSPEGLAAFVGSDEPHALRGIAEWDRLVEGLRPEYVAATEEDHYELDLVVRNLRGGHDAWEPQLIVSAGEITRDLAFALRIKAVQTSLSPGSPLDDLDDALRGVINGGIGGFLAKRRTRKIGAQQAALAWRTIVGKISAAVDWRD
jgi:hypothetical protein